MIDHMIRIVTADGTLRGAAALTTTLVEETRRRQGTDPTATVALGRLLTGTTLMGCLLKENQRLALAVEGNGPLMKLHAETDAFGHVRGAVKVPVAGLPPKDGRYDVSGAVGRAGFLHVVKDIGLKEPYRGMVQLVSSEIAEDLAYYLTTSEQVPSSLTLGVSLEGEGSVSAAGGVLIQALPGGSDSMIELVEKRLIELPSVTSLLKEGLTPRLIFDLIFEGIPFRIQSETPVAFRCSCSRSQVLGILRSLGEEEIARIGEKGETSVTCEYCKEVYRFSPEEVAGTS